MKVEPKKYLYDMLDKARYLVALSHERSLDDMDSDRVLAAAVERELMIVGEACFLLNERSPATAQAIDGYQDIIAMRHKLVHGYSAILPSILKSTVEQDLPPLISQLESMLNK